MAAFCLSCTVLHKFSSTKKGKKGLANRLFIYLLIIIIIFFKKKANHDQRINTCPMNDGTNEWANTTRHTSTIGKKIGESIVSWSWREAQHDALLSERASLESSNSSKRRLFCTQLRTPFSRQSGDSAKRKQNSTNWKICLSKFIYPPARY